MLTTMSLGLFLSPAAAAPDTDQQIDAVQTRVDKLAQKADSAEQRHAKAAAKLKKSKTQLRRTSVDLKGQQRLIEALRAQVAGVAVDEYAGSAGSAAPSAGSPVLDAQVRKESTALLANVVLVSEDAGTAGDALTDSNDRLTQLSERKESLQRTIELRARGEEASRSSERTAADRESRAAAKLAALEAKRIAEMGGPAVAYAKSQVGDAYVWGATGPDAFDCSGLTMAAWAEAGVSLPHNSQAQYNSGRQISQGELQPGDLVFYYTPISHVGMYIGNGQVVNAQNPGTGVRVSGLHDMPYVGAVRPGG